MNLAVETFRQDINAAWQTAAGVSGSAGAVSFNDGGLTVSASLKRSGMAITGYDLTVTGVDASAAQPNPSLDRTVLAALVHYASVAYLAAVKCK